MVQILMLLAVIFNLVILFSFIGYSYFLQKKKDDHIKQLEELINSNDKKRKVKMNNLRTSFKKQLSKQQEDLELNVADIMETYRTQITSDVNKIVNPGKWPYQK